jgi:hypothetical protein
MGAGGAMHGIGWALEVGLVLLLTATLVHAVRLERAVGVLKRDRAALDQLVTGFNAATRQAEDGIERLRTAADGAGRQIARQVDAAGALREDLGFLIERGERVADQIERAVRVQRAIAAEPAPRPDTMRADTMRSEGGRSEPVRVEQARAERPRLPVDEPARVRSQAERDLLRALKVAR